MYAFLSPTEGDGPSYVGALDIWHDDHREKWHSPVSPEMIEALTPAGSPCAGIRIGS